MKIFKVETWFMDRKIVFRVGANTAIQAMKIVDEKPATELLRMLTVRDITGSMSASPDTDSST